MRRHDCLGTVRTVRPLAAAIGNNAVDEED
jgi:hypothetical protein